jgi:hypothetical protein
MPKSSLLFSSLLLSACAVDSVEDALDTSTVSDEVTVLDNCATGTSANAKLLYDDYPTTDTYTRKGDPMINYTCGCRQWQRDANELGEEVADAQNPSCRATTFVNIQFDVSYPTPRWKVEVPYWSLTNGKTECLNSKLEVSILRETSPNHWELVDKETRQPTWDASSGTCNEVFISGVGTTSYRTRIKARATRGLFENNHGFETVKISAFGFGQPG